VRCLPLGTPVTWFGRSALGRLHGVVDRDLLEQSVVERFARAAVAAVLLWLAIYWAIS
jgi:hypothetical protein